MVLIGCLHLLARPCPFCPKYNAIHISFCNNFTRNRKRVYLSIKGPSNWLIVPKNEKDLYGNNKPFCTNQLCCICCPYKSWQIIFQIILELQHYILPILSFKNPAKLIFSFSSQLLYSVTKSYQLYWFKKACLNGIFGLFTYKHTKPGYIIFLRSMFIIYSNHHLISPLLVCKLRILMVTV